MEIKFSVGDKVYENDLTKKDFLDCQLRMIQSCVNNHWCLDSGEDDNGYFIEIRRSSKCGSDNLVFEQIRKKDEIKELWHSVQEQPIEYNGSYYDCDFPSVLQMRCILDAMQSNNLNVDCWTDSYNVDINNFYAEDLKNILNKYAQRCVKLHDVYKSLKSKIMRCKTIDELEEIDGSEFYIED